MARVFKTTGKNQRRQTSLFLMFFLLCFSLCLQPQASAQSDMAPFRFPVLSNPNALAGRLYLQPLDVHDHRVVASPELSVSFGSATDYNIHFMEKDGDKELTVNTNTYSLALSSGFSVAGRTLEGGALISAYQDMKNTWGGDLVKNYHEAFPSEGFGNVPPDGQYYGGVGENETPVIGENREFFLSTMQLYLKHQLLRDQGIGSPVPDLAVKLSGRIPLSGKRFDTVGLGLSAGLSKQLSQRFSAIGSGALVYQDLTNRDFNSNTLKVRHWVFDVFGGLCWDMGEQEGWYAQAGLRCSSERISYRSNSESADNAFVAHFGPVYRTKTKKGHKLEYFASFSEDIPGMGYGLEPDVAFYAGVAMGFH